MTIKIGMSFYAHTYLFLFIFTFIVVFLSAEDTVRTHSQIHV